jgi:ferredoxin
MPNKLPDEQKILEVHDFQSLIDVLLDNGYKVVGPAIRDRAIVYEEVNSVKDLPKGWTDKHGPGFYRIKERSDDALFGFNVGPDSWKKFLHPPKKRLWKAKNDGERVRFIPDQGESPKYAFIGVRSCELHAITIQDKVFINRQFVDQSYNSRRKKLFIVAINCGQAGETCFCDSMDTGPKATSGFDVALTEVLDGEQHHFVVETLSEKGKQVMSKVPHRQALRGESDIADKIVAETTRQMGRSMDTVNIKELLYENYDHPRWDDVAARCLTCANCTMVCPTCFCTTVEDLTDLTGENAERRRRWDSCFTLDFTYIHGGHTRVSAKSRYRQWMTHKLASWQDQFDTSGCVGCGRCISWCPVGIDITEEVDAMRTGSR